MGWEVVEERVIEGVSEEEIARIAAELDKEKQPNLNPNPHRVRKSNQTLN